MAVTTFAGLPATHLTGPRSDGYGSTVAAWGEEEDVIVMWLVAPTRDALLRSAHTWRKMARSVTWNEKRLSTEWKLLSELWPFPDETDGD